MKLTKRDRILEFIKKYYFVALVILAIVVKCAMTINLPINARDHMGADEYLMLDQSEQIASGNYLGNYNYLTLVKGIGFPVFLAFSYKIGIPLLLLYSLFYVGVCLVALVPIKRMVKRRPLQLLLFLLLLFCPATMDNNVQLIYRNMLIVPQSVLLVSTLMMMYYHVDDEKKGKLFGWSVLAALDWAFMWHTREDTIWSVPLLVVAWLVLLIVIVKMKKVELFSKEAMIRVGIISLPFVVLVASIHVISLINYKYYGVYMTNQLNQSNYTEAVMLMMSIKPEQEVDRVEITHETLLRLYDVSPSFATLKKVIEKDYAERRGLVMAHEDNGEINEDLITWELTGAASVNGYYENAQKAEEFWGKVHDEIKSAVEAGKLETRSILPSRSLIPYPNHSDSFDKLISSIGGLYLRVARYDSSAIRIDKATIDEDIVRRYEAMTGGYVVRANSEENQTDPMEAKAKRWTAYAERIRKIYNVIGPALLCISLLYYVGLTIFMIVRAIKKKECYFDRWLFLSMLLGSVTVMLMGLGYVNAFMVDVNGYLSGSNGLFSMFMMLAAILAIQDIIEAISVRRKCSQHKR